MTTPSLEGSARGGAPDLRVTTATLGAWGAVLAGLHWGVIAGLALTGAGAIIASVGLLSRRRGWWVVAAMFAVGVAAGGACTACQVGIRDTGVIHESAVRRAAVAVEGRIDDDPRRVGQRTPGGRSSYAVSLAVDRVVVAGRPWRVGGRVLVLSSDSGWAGLLPGQAVSVEGRLAPSTSADLTAAVLSARGRPVLHGRAPWYQRLAGGLRTDFQRVCTQLPAPQGGLLPGLVDGDVSRLDPSVEADFRQTGMTHLVAVSGSNCAIVMGTALMVLRRCGCGPRVTAGLAIVALVAFVVLVRPSPSVLRAAAMGGVTLLGLGLGRTGSAMPTLSVATGALLLVDPSLAASPGFALSVLATAGLVVIAPGFSDALRAMRVPSVLAEALAVPAAAQVACAPVIAAISGGIGLAAVPANVLAIPAVAPSTVLGVAAAVVAPASSTAAGWLAWLASWPAWWLVQVARVGAHVPDGVLPWPAGVGGGVALAGILATVLAAGRIPFVRQIAGIGVLAVVLVALPVRVLAPGWPPPAWLIVGCSVGQGDTVVLRSGPDAAVVVDAGPEPGAPDACLRRLGVRSIPLLIVSHFHADHVDGIDGVLRGRTVGAIIRDDFDQPDAGVHLVEEAARRHSVPITTTFVGATYHVGDVWMEVIGPERPLTATRSDPNNNSLVIRAVIRGVSVLLTGDAENSAQQSMLADHLALGAEVLKVPHHGSSFSEAAFLDAVHPRVGIVEVGLGNDYGHPNAGVLAHLRQLGATVLRTDLDGDVAVTDARGELAVVKRGTGVPSRPP